MKIIYTKIFYSEINPDKNFPDYGNYCKANYYHVATVSIIDKK